MLIRFCSFQTVGFKIKPNEEGDFNGKGCSCSFELSGEKLAEIAKNDYLRFMLVDVETENHAEVLGSAYFAASRILASNPEWIYHPNLEFRDFLGNVYCAIEFCARLLYYGKKYVVNFDPLSKRSPPSRSKCACGLSVEHICDKQDNTVSEPTFELPSPPPTPSPPPKIMKIIPKPKPKRHWIVSPTYSTPVGIDFSKQYTPFDINKLRNTHKYDKVPLKDD
jgi:hypothetical protein